MTVSRWFVVVAWACVLAWGAAWFAASRDLAACRAELAAVRDSLRVERADLIACYQGRTPAPDLLDWSKLDADTVRSGRVVVWP